MTIISLSLQIVICQIKSSNDHVNLAEDMEGDWNACLESHMEVKGGNEPAISSLNIKSHMISSVVE